MCLRTEGFELRLVNAKHVKMVPGRKTDLADAAWLAELLEHGLLGASFVPPAAIRELRDLTRYRKRLIQTHTAEQQRVAEDLGGCRDQARLGRVGHLRGVGPARCSRPSSPANVTPRRLPSWPKESFATRSRCCAEALHGAGSVTITPRCCASSSTTSLISKPRSPRSMSRSTG